MNIKEILDKHLKWINNETGGERAYLGSADLTGADLRSADLRSANLSGADLTGAELTGANLRSANLRGANIKEELLISFTSICPEGDLIGWKKCKNNVIVKVKIPSKAKRSNATGRKCRAEYVKVLEIFNDEYGISIHDQCTKYEVGKTIRCDKWDDDRWNECSGGIHFFLTRLEAERY